MSSQETDMHIAADTLPAEFVFPVSASQFRCWYLDQLRPDNPSLNVVVRWELCGNVSDDRIETAVRMIIERHEILRTRIVERDGLPVQEVLPGISFELERCDLRDLDGDAKLQAVERIGKDLSDSPMNLAQPPLIRVGSVQVDEDRRILHVVAHQAIFDGYSIKVLGSEFGQILNALESGFEVELQPLNLQYGDYALWQEEYLASDAVKQEETYWRSILADMAYFEVEPDFDRPAVKSTEGAAVRSSLPTSFGERLERAARGHNVSPFVLGVSVLSSALHHFTGAREVVFGTQVTGRDESDLEPLIGVFLNNIVLRVPSPSGTTFSDHVATARRVVVDAVTHQKFPFNRLVAALKPARDLSRNPIISINFNFQRSTFLENRKYDSFELISRPSHAPGIVYDLNFQLIGRPDGWLFGLEYSKELFAEETMRQLLDLVVEEFELAFTEPERRLANEVYKRPPVGLPTGPEEAIPAPERAKTQTPIETATITEFPLYNRQREEMPETTAASPIAGDEIEERVVRIWSRLLELEPALCRGDFFDLGGHSLLAMRMLSATRTAFGIKPDINDFLADPTLRAFAILLREKQHVDAIHPVIDEPPEGAPGTWKLAVLRTASAAAPVIVTLNHPLFYYILAKQFPNTFTIVNLYIPDHASIAAQAEMTFEEICRDAAHCIAARYEDRPIGVMGLCVNGRVAFNTAQHLERMKRDVCGLIMIDSWAPRAAGELSRFARLRMRWSERASRWSHYIRQWRQGQIPTAELIGKTRLGAALVRHLGKDQGSIEDIKLLVDVTGHLVSKSLKHKFEPFEGSTVLFKTDAAPVAAFAEKFGWSELVDIETPVYPATGWHEDALSNVGIGDVAEIIEKRTLARAAKHLDKHSTTRAADGTTSAA